MSDRDDLVGSYLPGNQHAGAPLPSSIETETMRPAVVVPYVLALVAVVVGVDILFFRHHFGERLIANVGIVLVFGAFYLRFLKRP
jgi:hypothetical protein